MSPTLRQREDADETIMAAGRRRAVLGVSSIALAARCHAVTLPAVTLSSARHADNTTRDVRAARVPDRRRSRRSLDESDVVRDALPTRSGGDGDRRVSSTGPPRWSVTADSGPRTQDARRRRRRLAKLGARRGSS